MTVKSLKFQAGKSYLDADGKVYRILEISGRGRNWAAWVSPGFSRWPYNTWFKHSQCVAVLVAETSTKE